MTRRTRFDVRIAEAALRHLDGFELKHQRLLRAVIEDQLVHQPTVETRNRKLLRPPAPFEAEWELRCGPQNRFRVLYDVDEDEGIVQVLAFGIKERERVHFPGEEVE